MGRAAGAIASELQALDSGVIVSRSAADAAAVVASDPGLGVIVADWALTQEGDGSTLVDRVRAQNEDIPVFLMTTRGSFESVPAPWYPSVTGLYIRWTIRGSRAAFVTRRCGTAVSSSRPCSR
ncbi:MAG TPA: Orn/Lys/Arg decarboxylase N-terminal domain-containing protein, partial [Mycobacterium sp.]|nr:Orn/Lys/Arg decarboxylase N-terminal domain-containing protein [Mycobacterium sp.]